MNLLEPQKKLKKWRSKINKINELNEMKFSDYVISKRSLEKEFNIKISITEPIIDNFIKELKSEFNYEILIYLINNNVSSVRFGGILEYCINHKVFTNEIFKIIDLQEYELFKLFTIKLDLISTTTIALTATTASIAKIDLTATTNDMDGKDIDGNDMDGNDSTDNDMDGNDSIDNDSVDAEKRNEKDKNIDIEDIKINKVPKKSAIELLIIDIKSILNYPKNNEKWKFELKKLNIEQIHKLLGIITHNMENTFLQLASDLIDSVTLSHDLKLKMLELGADIKSEMNLLLLLESKLRGPLTNLFEKQVQRIAPTEYAVQVIEI